MLRFFPTSPVTMNIKINDSTFGYFIDNEIQCLLISEFQNKNVKTKMFTVNGIIPTEMFDLLLNYVAQEQLRLHHIQLKLLDQMNHVLY